MSRSLSLKAVLLGLLFAILGAAAVTGFTLYAGAEDQVDTTRRMLATAREEAATIDKELAQLRAQSVGQEDEVDALTAERDQLLQQVRRLRAASALEPRPRTPSSPQPLDLNLRSGEIATWIADEYLYLYCDEPTPGETRYWTDLIVDIGMDLQAEGLDPESALREAIARGLQEIEATPSGQFMIENGRAGECGPRPRP